MPQFVFVVTEPALNAEVIKRPWAAKIYRWYLTWYRWSLLRGIERWRKDGANRIVVLTSPEILHPDMKLPGLDIRSYDVEINRVDFHPIAIENERFINDWNQVGPNERISDLDHRGVPLTEVFKVQLGIELHLEITWYLGTIRLLFNESKPDLVCVMTGASYPERIAEMMSHVKGVDCRRLGFNFVSSAIPLIWSWLLTRSERRKQDFLVNHVRRDRNQTGNSSVPTILMTVCRGRQLQAYTPLLNAIAGLNSATVDLLAIGEMDSVLKHEMTHLNIPGVRPAYCMDYVSKQDAKNLLIQARPKFARLWKDIDAFSKARAQTYHDGIDLFSLASNLLKIFTTQGSLVAMLYAESAHRCLQKTRPAGVLAASDRRYPERATILLAKAAGIPTSFYLNNTILARDLTNKYDIADHVLVVGENVKQSMERLGYGKGEILAVGDPRFDYQPTETRENFRERICNTYGLDSKRPIVVMASKYTSANFTIQDKEWFYALLGSAFARFPQCQWVVKVHPNEDSKTLQQQFKEWGTMPDAVVQNIDIVTLFKIADTAIMATSMAGLEAMILKVPLIAIQPTEKDYDMSNIIPYIKSGAVYRVKSAEELTKGIDQLTTDTELRRQLVQLGFEFALRYIREPDGQTAQRILTSLSGAAGFVPRIKVPSVAR